MCACVGAPDPISLSRLAPVSRRSEGLLLEAARARLVPSEHSGWNSAVDRPVQQVEQIQQRLSTSDPSGSVSRPSEDSGSRRQLGHSPQSNLGPAGQRHPQRHISQYFMQVGSPRHLDREQDKPERGGGVLFREGHKARRRGARLPRLAMRRSYQALNQNHIQNHTVLLCYPILPRPGTRRLWVCLGCALDAKGAIVCSGLPVANIGMLVRKPTCALVAVV